MTEKQWLSQVTELAQLLHWHVYHTWNSMHSSKGFPDLALVRERLILAELKSEKGNVTYEQSEWLSRLELAGVETYIWRPSQLDEVMKILRRK